MAARTRPVIPFSEVVQPIVDEPLEMARRLDFADWLERQGDAPRARWTRACCAVCDAVSPLALGLGKGAGLIRSTPWGIVDLTGSAVDRWHEVRPDYWSEIVDATQTAYFGRIAVWAPAIEGLIERIGDIPWLVQAFNDGWLESIWLDRADGRQLGQLVGWPTPHQKLPVWVDSTYYSSDGVDNGLMREVLLLEGLHGLAMSPTEIRYACAKRLGELATNLRYLQLLSLKAASTSLAVLEQLAHLRKLCSLTVGGNLPDDSSISLLTTIPHLRTVRLYAKKVTDSGLLQLAQSKSLRVLAIDNPNISRAGIEALRLARPDVNVIVERDMRCRLGPV